MCLSPIHILNRSRRFRVGIDKPVLTVPCGKCEECQSRKMDDWFVRACAEYQRCINNGGFVWFPTLTYRNEDLPIWKDDDLKFIAPVFDKSHFVSFRTKLRVYLKRLGFDFSGENTIRFIYVCEYGSVTGRSHLHCLLFVPKRVPFPLFKKLVKKAWVYGMVRYSPSGDCIQSVKGLRYTMKYMHKDLMWYDKYNVDNYIAELKGLSNTDNLEQSNYYKSKLKAFRYHLPHHCQSMGFGCSFCCTDNEFIDDSISSSRLGLYDLKFNYHVPMYYKRKFLYDFDNVDKLYTINPRGKNIKQSQFNKLIDKLDKYYASLVYSNIVDDLLDNFVPQLNVQFKDSYDCFKELHNYDTKDIAIYAMVYRGLALKKNNIESLNVCNSDEFLNNNRCNAYFYFCSSLSNENVPLVDNYKYNGAKEASTYFGYDDTNVYRLFNRGLNFIEIFEHVIGEMKNHALEKEYYNQSIQFGKLFHLI